MKFAAFFLSSIVTTCFAAPALVWKHGRDPLSPVTHSSTPVHASEVISDVTGSSSELAAIFLIGRSADGSESLSAMTSNGSLPGVASKYEEASIIHHHCGGVESPHAMAKMANSLSISLSEFSSIMENPNPTSSFEVDANGMTKSAKESHNRARALAVAKVVIVNIPASTNPADVDSAVVKAIESNRVGSVMLTGVRSTDEVKMARANASRRRVLMQQEVTTGNGRRLEEQNDDANGGNKNMAGVYYVQMTPNILAGILFGLLFAFIAYTGITCMGMISGQDVFVTKMPSVGREA